MKKQILTTLLAGGALAGASLAHAGVVDDPNDVMNGAMPKFPTFAKIQKKPGFIRGLVKDTTGKPLKGARISISSTAIGGARTYVSAKSDENGLYEVELPMGACEVGSAGYVVTLNGLRAALPLHPVDGELDTFASKKGEVENFVLLPYGVASEAGVGENPNYDFYYYGGSVKIVYWTQSGSRLVPVGATIEITLTPQGKLIDGSKGQTLVIHQPVKEHDPGTFPINNIPAGPYQIEARLIENGQATPLLMIDNAVQRRDGLKPKTATGTATLIFSPKKADPAAVVLNVSGWENVSIEVSREDGETPEDAAGEEASDE